MPDDRPSRDSRFSHSWLLSLCVKEIGHGQPQLDKGTPALENRVSLMQLKGFDMS